MRSSPNTLHPLRATIDEAIYTFRIRVEKEGVDFGSARNLGPCQLGPNVS